MQAIRKSTIPAALVCATIFNTVCELTGGIYTDVVCLLMVIAWAVYAIWALTGERKSDQTCIQLLLSASFAVGLLFVLKLPYTFSWHDLAAYEIGSDGHLGFVAWIVENGRLPLELNPMDADQSIFYNPPLHHIMLALFMKINLMFGLPEGIALENLQVITLILSFACVRTSLQLMKELDFSPRAIRTGLWAIAFQPMLMLLGATLNNDILMIFCVLRCAVHVIRWQKRRKMADILFVALFLGCGMATKLNAALLIPCIAPVFAVAFFKDGKARYLSYAKQFALFLLISVPIAISWPVYHMVAFDMPLNFVRLPAETINVSHLSLGKRYGIPDWFARRELFYSPTRNLSHNVWMQTAKSGIFDELTLFSEGTLMWYIAYMLLMIFVGLLVIGAVGFLLMVIRRRDASGFFLLGYGVLLLVSYLKFTLDYPYICTFNFRYIAPILTLGALGFAHWRERLRRIGWMAECYAAGYSLLVLFVYGRYFFP